MGLCKEDSGCVDVSDEGAGCVGAREEDGGSVGVTEEDREFVGVMTVVRVGKSRYLRAFSTLPKLPPGALMLGSIT